jgi:hypothetical protein
MRNNKTNLSILILDLIAAGLNDLEIAKRLGWTVGTLRVRCSQLGISLLRRKVALPPVIMDQLHQRAESMGVSASALAAGLLEVIARDGLYDAVLDRGDAEIICAHESLQ